ncbi:MAG: bifunctional methylenetetrahydrofolate dehydrogenase/methenyltetrahydrofolate cyclohydrolase FolD [Nitrosomonadales bacterium]|jgi:methylenetetrahydrofolate dehydrogenase (NADP+)/methenyltetrahydrofolate cyclohydrolase|nr:bifunctional methylenetetrahydrofolate dehydrogenase/methenyltetrahydrofolate cyclohydrolase FolD [Nitrosomonadales bacterium]MBT4664395.1 bifunctional methylenetetrahydrofolate dehydrogenase/methenyltetrahydrofolate cyclohydrolase FolD [Methylococcales bacterium]MBT4571726.1 bifunctional methylenetetrahydrofolate dehydrogenase/methenyltetrahydrofolate cyclohydrolase FolD [Nitrosomonadales bacterium]MBT4760023.1 bifunctional methylenetetrahydrofolate dehydrogenase/methenyltetrahydrofolate cyc
MAAKIIDGNVISKEYLSFLKQEILNRKKDGIRPPCLAVILVGDDPASSIYVNKKKSACENVGIKSISHHLATKTSQSDLNGLIKTLNQDKSVDGILVQSPLPKHLNERLIIDLISPNKDVDGFHPINVGLLAIKSPKLRPCTPYGIIRMLKAANINLEGLDATVVGASNNVGRPMVLELLLAGCTVTSCHSRTKNIEQKVKNAQLLVVGVGRPEMIKGSWIQDGAIVIDIGITRVGNKLTGDVEFDEAQKKASYITPVPGGVGPMTVSTLMENTLQAQKLSELSLQ